MLHTRSRVRIVFWNVFPSYIAITPFLLPPWATLCLDLICISLMFVCAFLHVIRALHAVPSISSAWSNTYGSARGGSRIRAPSYVIWPGRTNL
ncbi:hypothetical protein FKM82_025482 [Ascaphus truei]